jgi:hypothetical protein
VGAGVTVTTRTQAALSAVKSNLVSIEDLGAEEEEEGGASL